MCHVDKIYVKYWIGAAGAVVLSPRSFQENFVTVSPINLWTFKSHIPHNMISEKIKYWDLWLGHVLEIHSSCTVIILAVSISSLEWESHGENLQ